MLQFKSALMCVCVECACVLYTGSAVPMATYVRYQCGTHTHIHDHALRLGLHLSMHDLSHLLLSTANTRIEASQTVLSEKKEGTEGEERGERRGEREGGSG